MEACCRPGEEAHTKGDTSLSHLHVGTHITLLEATPQLWLGYEVASKKVRGLKAWFSGAVEW